MGESLGDLAVAQRWRGTCQRQRALCAHSMASLLVALEGFIRTPQAVSFPGGLVCPDSGPSGPCPCLLRSCLL